MKEGRAPFSFDFGHKQKNEGMSRSFHLSVLATNAKGVAKPRSFHASDLIPFTPRFWPQSERRKKAALFSLLDFDHKSPFTLFCPQPERRKKVVLLSFLDFVHKDKRKKTALLSLLGFGHKPRRKGKLRSFHPSFLDTNRDIKKDRAPFTPRFRHKPRGERRPRSFHLSVLPTNREMKEGRAPFTPRFWPQPDRRRKAAPFSLIGFDHKPRSERRPRSFRPSFLATNREVKESRVPFTSQSWPQTERRRKVALLYRSVLPTTRDGKESRATFTSRFWSQTEE